MSQNFTGKCIKATHLLNTDIHFANAVILISEHNENGAMGFNLNRKHDRSFNELVEFSNSPALPIWIGGPVAMDKLFFIHQRPDLIEGSKPIAPGIYYGGNFKKTVHLINRLVLTENDLKLFIGYCGWNIGELESEIEEGSWVPEETGNPFL